jgi:hypothetical protein
MMTSFSSQKVVGIKIGADYGAIVSPVKGFLTRFYGPYSAPAGHDH